MKTTTKIVDDGPGYGSYFTLRHDCETCGWYEYGQIDRRLLPHGHPYKTGTGEPAENVEALMEAPRSCPACAAGEALLLAATTAVSGPLT